MKYIASSDAGNGVTNTFLMPLDKGTVKSIYVPSVRSAATKATLGLSNEVSREYVDWGGNTYYVGDEATRTAQERHMGAGRYGEEFSRFMTAVSLAKLGVKEGAVSLTLFAPPGLYMDVQKDIIANFMEHGGKVKIQLKGDKKPREWHYKSVSVLPEGVGAALAFGLDESGNIAETDVLTGESVVLDIGAFSTDALKFQNGNFDPDSLEQATWQNAGVNLHIWQRLRAKLRKMNEDFEVVTVDDIDRVIRTGFATGNWILSIAGKDIDLKSACDRYFEEYADWLANNICDGVFNGFRGIKSVLLVGGGAVMVGNKLRRIYADKIVDPRKYPHIKKLHPGDLNAAGGLRLALRNLKSK